MHHYRWGQRWIDNKRAIRISWTAKFLPAHCSLPAILEEDSTVLAAEEFVIKINDAIKMEYAYKTQYIKNVKQLTEII